MHAVMSVELKKNCSDYSNFFNIIIKLKNFSMYLFNLFFI
jgi:hypothetical protein